MGEAGVAVERDDAAAVGQGETDLDGPVGLLQHLPYYNKIGRICILKYRATLYTCRPVQVHNLPPPHPAWTRLSQSLSRF